MVRWWEAPPPSVLAIKLPNVYEERNIPACGRVVRLNPADPLCCAFQTGDVPVLGSTPRSSLNLSDAPSPSGQRLPTGAASWFKRCYTFMTPAEVPTP